MFDYFFIIFTDIFNVIFKKKTKSSLALLSLIWKVFKFDFFQNFKDYCLWIIFVYMLKKLKYRLFEYQKKFISDLVSLIMSRNFAFC